MHDMTLRVIDIPDSFTTSLVTFAAILAPPLTAFETALSGFPSGSFLWSSDGLPT